MGKLSIIPRSDTVRDYARARNGAEEARTTAAPVRGSSATSGAIADSAAADRDYYRFLIASIGRNDDVPSSREGEFLDGFSASPKVVGGDVSTSDQLVIAARQKHRVSIVARLREKDTEVEPNLLARDHDDDDVVERTCCATLLARRRAREDFIGFRRSRNDERRNRRRAVNGGSVSAERSADVVDDIAIGREDRDRLAGVTNRVSKCDVGVNARNDNICNFPRLTGFVKPSCIFAEEVARRNTSSSLRFPARIEHRGGQVWRIKTCRGLPRIGFVLRAFLLGLLMMSLFCDLVLAAPSSSSLEAMDIFEDDIEEELVIPRNKLGEDELQIIRRSIVQGLGLQRIPDASKANVSQAEYERAHREYLKQVQLSHDEQESRRRRDLRVFQTAEHPGNRSSVNWKGGNHRHFLYFPVTVSHDTEEDVTVDHASLRFLLQGDHRRPRDLEVLVYIRTPISQRLLLRHKISQRHTTDSRWLELDFTEAAASWLERNLDNYGLELEFLHDGRPTRRDISYTTLNVFIAFESGGRRKRSTLKELMPLHKGRRSKCKGDNNKKCCRHELTVMFKDLEGFEFIVYPKGFDAGYCKGRCPPRYNPAHHHALLQSLLWKEDRKRVPKPCCAPSKLDQLRIVYFDENDSTHLKVSYWKSIQVLECACS
ncbi:bone morphogenetic protein 4 [Nylanderia fulva]|uniref:bone morphogenetic protein 4 n=1 Tax=Nylanderia fulva TaxID=613905 RepID=UPI0010FB7BFC|nr:bone morphogenetic protein 4 [Nylanderia fulva]